MRKFEMDIFEEMDYIIDKFFTELDNTVIYTEPEEEPEEEEFDAWEALTPWERNVTLSGFLGGMY